MALFDNLFRKKNRLQKEVDDQVDETAPKSLEKALDVMDDVIDDTAKEVEVLTEESSQSEQEEIKATTKEGLFARFKKGLSKTRENLSGKIENLIKNTKKIDDDFYEELEEILIQGDVGAKTAFELVENLRAEVRKNKIKDADQIMGIVRDAIKEILLVKSDPLVLKENTLNVIMVVGVNGTGKTTSIAKLAYRFKKENKKVILAAGDTFRAAAIDQLQVWADRVGVELVKHKEGSDPGAVVYDSIQAAKARKADVLIIDTAGRLQNKVNLMKEISKVRHVISKEVPETEQEVLLVLDATTGQNAISQAKIFLEATGVTGIILTKLDGTAKGGIIIAISRELDIPVKLVGMGEQIEDLRDFSADIFAAALFES